MIDRLRRQESGASRYRRRNTASNPKYRYSNKPLEAGRKLLRRDTQLESSSTEVPEHRRDNACLGLLVAESGLLRSMFHAWHKRRMVGAPEALEVRE